MKAKNNSKEVIRQEIKIIAARIKDKRKTCDRVDKLFFQLNQEINILEKIEDNLRQSLTWDMEQ